MIKINDKQVDLKHFPDGTLLLKELAPETEPVVLSWFFENNEELVALYFLTKHLQAKGITNIELKLPYIPNARQDRVKAPEDVFTLKYFAQMINELHFSKVTVLDPHSYVSEALINNIRIQTFFPDEGAMKRYSSMFELPYAFGMKKRDWTTGQILGLEAAGQTEVIKGSTILIVDDICSKGGTFYYSAKALKELGAEKVYLYISHCENSILEGDLIKSDLVEKVFTTNSIFTKEHEKVEVFDYE